MNLLHLAPINVATCLSLLQPSQIGISLYHRINGLAYGLLINLFDIDANAFGGLDNKLPLSNQLALTQGFIGIAFTFGAEPGEVAFTLGVALIVQVLDSFKDDRTAAIENDVLAAVELGDLVQLVATTFQSEVSARLDLGAYLSRAGYFVHLRLFSAPASLLLHVIQGMRTVLSRQQIHLLPAVQIRFIPRTDLARHQRRITPGLTSEIPTRGQHTGHLGGLLIRRLDAFFAVFFLTFNTVHIADRHHVEIAPDVDIDVFASGGRATDDVYILPSLHIQIAPRRNAGGEVFDVGGDAGFVPAVAEFVLHAGIADGQQAEVAASGEGDVVAACKRTAIDEVTTGLHHQVVAGADGASTVVGEGAHARAIAHLNRGGVVGDVAFEGGEVDLGAANFTGHGVANAVLGQQGQVVARFDQAAVVETAAGGGGGEVVAGAQGADVEQVAASDQVEVAALDQAAAAYIA